MKVAISVALLGVAIANISGAAGAQGLMALKTGEQTTGMTKQCYYSAAGQEYTRTVSSVSLCPLSIQVPSVPQIRAPSIESPSGGSIMAFKTGENTTGMTKQCFYNGLGNQYVRTVSAVALCPLSIQIQR